MEDSTRETVWISRDQNGVRYVYNQPTEMCEQVTITSAESTDTPTDPDAPTTERGEIIRSIRAVTHSDGGDQSLADMVAKIYAVLDSSRFPRAGSTRDFDDDGWDGTRERAAKSRET